MDRQTTIERLEEMEQWLLNKSYSDLQARDHYEIVGAAIDLLKEEPVKPIFDELDVSGACGNCGHTLTHQKMIGENVLFEERYDYCPACGRKVLWE